MQSARSLMSHHVETPESLRGHGEFHGRGNIDPAYKQAAFDKSVFQRILNRFPQNVRVPVAVGGLVAGGIVFYQAFRPRAPKGKEIAMTRTKEWDRQTAQLLKDQRTPTHQKSG